MLQFDQQHSENGATRVDGNGWLVGPYLTTRLRDQPLTFDARLLWGQSQNDVTTANPGTRSFDSARVLAQVGVSGHLDYGTLRLTPSLSGAITRDQQKSFAVPGGLIPEQSVTKTQVQMGLDFTRPMTLGGELTASYSETSGTGALGLEMSYTLDF